MRDIFRPDVLETIKSSVDNLSSELRALSIDIHDNPEIMFEEVHAHEVLTNFLEKHGFSVQRHYSGLKTAFRAEFSKIPGRVIGVNSEMDALPGIGHACGHNLIAIAGVGVAVALKEALIKHELPGKVVILGTPAEEGGNGKGILIERGGYDDMDVCIMCHPGPGEEHGTGVGSTLAMDSITVEFHGHTAHAAMAPWEGQNALDAAHLSYTSVSMLRQQIKPDHRVHGVVYGRNWAANIIPDYAQMRWFVRAPTWEEVEVLRERVMNCFRAAGKATSCKVKLSTAAGTKELKQNGVLAEEYLHIAEDGLGMVANRNSPSRASTDFGNVTYFLPSLHPHFAIPTEENGGNHTPVFTGAARTIEAHQAAISTIKALAHTAVRVLLDDEFFAKNSFRSRNFSKGAQAQALEMKSIGINLPL